MSECENCPATAVCLQCWETLVGIGPLIVTLRMWRSFGLNLKGAKRIANQDLVKLNPLGTNFVNPKHGVLEDQ